MGAGMEKVIREMEIRTEEEKKRMHILYTIKVETRDDPRYMIIKYKNTEIKLMEEYKERFKKKYVTKCIIESNFVEENKVFYITISFFSFINFQKDMFKEITVSNIKIDSIKKVKRIVPPLDPNDPRY